MKIKFLHPAMIGVISTVIGGLILYEVELLHNLIVKILSSIRYGVLVCWDALMSDYSINGWLILIFGLFSIVGLLLVMVRLYSLLKPQTKREYLNYTEDFIYGAKWRWSWNQNRISNLWCYCPSCDAQLIYQEELIDTHLICEWCTHGQQFPKSTAILRGNWNYARDATKREISRRVRTNEYRTTKNGHFQQKNNP